MSFNPYPYRQKILELYDEGPIGKDELVSTLVNWISEIQAKEFCELWEEYMKPCYENDGQPDEAQEWHDFDPDC